jgi:hypothetical protein
MSLESLCSVSSATIKRVVSTQSAAGGEVRAYTTANRGSLPTSTTGRMNQSGGVRRFAWGGHDMTFDAVWYTTTDPQCDNRDQLVLGTEIYFVQAQKNPDHLDAYYILGLNLTSRNLQQ